MSRENSAIDVENDGINDGINYISIDDNEAHNLTVYLIATRCGIGISGIIIAYLKYTKKDIH